MPGSTAEDPRGNTVAVSCIGVFTVAGGTQGTDASVSGLRRIECASTVRFSTNGELACGHTADRPGTGKERLGADGP